MDHYVKMFHAFVPALEFITVSIYFKEPMGSSIILCTESNGYELYDRTTDELFKFNTKEEFVQKVSTYLTQREVDDFKVSGFSIMKE
jgi:hypothetical protein